MFAKAGLRKEKDKPNISGASQGSQNPESLMSRQVQSVSETVPRQPAQHLLGALPVTHIPLTVRASSAQYRAQYRAQITDLTNLGQDPSGSSMPRDKSISIPMATTSQVPGLGPYWLLQAAVAVSARPIFSQEYLSPNIGNPSMMSLKSPEQSRGSGQPPTGGTSLGQEMSGDILMGLNNS